MLLYQAAGEVVVFLGLTVGDSKTGDVQQSPPSDCTRGMLSLQSLLFYLDVCSKVCAGF